jgi:hypothetical protein
MSEGLSRVEQELVEPCRERPIFLGLDGSIRMLAREIQRNEEAAVLPPHAMAVRVSLTTDLSEKMEQAQAFLAKLSQTLAALQEEQVKQL